MFKVGERCQLVDESGNFLTFVEILNIDEDTLYIDNMFLVLEDDAEEAYSVGPDDLEKIK